MRSAGSERDGESRAPPRPGGNSASLLEELHFLFPFLSVGVSSPGSPSPQRGRGGALGALEASFTALCRRNQQMDFNIRKLRFVACWFYFVKPLQGEKKGVWGTPGGAAAQNVNSPQQQSKAGLKTAVREVGKPFSIENTILWRFLPSGAAESS